MVILGGNDSFHFAFHPEKDGNFRMEGLSVISAKDGNFHLISGRMPSRMPAVSM
jgi:hypothetical protein